MPRFSIIIPCYNVARWVRSALDSIYAQPGEDFEVIAVDDGSTDETAAVLNSYGRKLCVLSQSNKGTGAARNLGLSNATGDYFLFLDGDDVWFPWTLTRYRELIHEFQDPSVVAGRPMRFKKSADLSHAGSAAPTVAKLYPNFYEAARVGFWYLLPSALAVRRDVWETCGGYADLRINSEDNHFFMKFGVRPGFVAVSMPPMFGYRMHGHNASLNANMNHSGCLFLIEQEKDAAYPGGVTMRGIRRTILTTQARAASVSCLDAGATADGWKLYLTTFWWNLVQGRVKYLLGFPTYAILAKLKSICGRSQL